MWVGDQFWHCSYLKTEHKDKVAQKKSPFPQSLLFFLKNKHRQPTQQQHTGEGALPVSAWRDIMPQCQSDVQASMIGECEKNVRDRWVTVQIHTHTHTWFNIQGTHRWCKAFCLPLEFLIDIVFSSWLQILAWRSKGGRKAGKEWDSEEEDKKRDVWHQGQIYVPLVCNEIDLLIPTMQGWQLIGNGFIWERADSVSVKEDIQYLLTV